jgi:hypothetical protein
MGVLRVVGRDGDTEYPYGARDFAQAKRAFDHGVVYDQMLAFTVDPKTGEGSERIKQFDPKADEIIMTRRMVGG